MIECISLELLHRLSPVDCHPANTLGLINVQDYRIDGLVMQVSNLYWIERLRLVSCRSWAEIKQELARRAVIASRTILTRNTKHRQTPITTIANTIFYYYHYYYRNWEETMGFLDIWARLMSRIKTQHLPLGLQFDRNWIFGFVIGSSFFISSASLACELCWANSDFDLPYAFFVFGI